MDARTLSRVVPLFLAALLSGSTALATTYVVKPDGTGDFPTIQAAINACVDGDVVELTDGTFTGDGNRDIFCSKSVTVRSQNGNPSTTIIDCEQAGRGFYIREADSIVLQGMTITNGHSDIGGGIRCRYSRLTLVDCVLSTNSATSNGGGLYCGHGSSLTVTRCHFLENLIGSYTGDSRGGGLCCDGGGSSGTFNECVFSGNVAASPNDDAFGGGFDLDGHATFIDCMFSENRAEGRHAFGGGVYSSVGSETRFERCEFVGNQVRGIGGGLCLEEESDVTITDCAFTENAALDGLGAGLYCSGSSPVITACTFADNRLEGNSIGGAGTCCVFPSSPYFEHCAFVGNEAQSEYAVGGGAAALLGATPTFVGCTLSGNAVVGGRASGGGLGLLDASVTVNNTIIAFSSSGEAVSCDGASTATLTCTDVYGNAGGDWVGCIAGQLGSNGNISEDPLFCDAPNGDFTLHAESPCAPENSPAGCGLIGAWPVGCGATSVTLERVSSPSIRLRVHPNPIRNSGVVEWMGDGGAVALRLYDPKGRLVLAREMDGRQSGLRRVGWGDLVGGRSLAPGIYFLELGRSAGRWQSARVIVVR